MTYIIVLLAVLVRFVPHVPNFSPVYAALLFCGAYLRRRDSIWYPVALLAASDVVLDVFVYHMRLGWRSEALDLAGFAVLALVGRWLHDRISAKSVIAASLAAPAAFFFISNLGVWLEWKMYPPTWGGLLACYVAALPFFRNSLLSSLLFSGVLFGGYEFYRRKHQAPKLDRLAVHRG